MKYCESCKAKVRPVKKKPFKWGAFFMWGLCFGIGALIYALVHALRRKKFCPVHGIKVISIKKAKKKGYLDPIGRQQVRVGDNGPIYKRDCGTCKKGPHLVRPPESCKPCYTSPGFPDWEQK